MEALVEKCSASGSSGSTSMIEKSTDGVGDAARRLRQGSRVSISTLLAFVGRSVVVRNGDPNTLVSK